MTEIATGADTTSEALGHRRILVTGSTGFLGERVVEMGIDALITVGSRASLINEGAAGLKGENLNFNDHSEAAAHLRGQVAEGDLLLVKGSRAAGMEQVITLFN